MQFLLECIGFGPDHDLDDLQRRLQREGLYVRGRSGEGDHQRLLLSHGLEVWLDPGRPATASAPAIDPMLWPGVAPGRPSAFQVRGLEDPHGAPFSSVVRASLAERRSATPQGGARESEGDAPDESTRRRDGGPVIGWSFALVDDGPPPQVGEVVELALTGFALDVTAVLPAPPGGRARLDGARGWVTPQFSGPELPGCLEVALPIDAVQVLHNPLTGEPVERVLTTTSAGVRLELFTSRWQRAEDGLAPLEPGGWIAGTFLAVGRRAEGYPFPRRAVSRRRPARL
ncbi:MAG: ubiquitin family protein [Planctomycetota bacterium]